MWWIELLMSPSKYSLQEKPEVRMLVPSWHLRFKSWRGHAEIRSDRPWRDHGDIRYPKQIARRNGRGEETIGVLKFGYGRADTTRRCDTAYLPAGQRKLAPSLKARRMK